jgi:hypothetical protein
MLVHAGQSTAMNAAATARSSASNTL